MGEPEYLSSSTDPLYIVIMRNSRGKLFVSVGVVCVLFFVIFLLSSTHNNLKELEGVIERCEQQRDSLSAQLQVVYEHKSRLEKSLQQEKADHKHTRELSEKQATDSESKLHKIKEEKQKVDVQVSQLKTSYSELEDEKTQLENALKEQLKATQKQKDSEIEKLQAHISDLLAEKDKLETSNNGFIWKIHQHESEINLCHAQLQQSRTELNLCKETCLEKEGIKSKKPVANATVDETNSLRNLIKMKPENTPNIKENMVISEKVKLQKSSNHNGNKTTPSQSHGKPSLLEKPAIMPFNNIGDGVLPKPLDIKHDEIKDVDAAIEDMDLKKNEKVADENLLKNINERYEGKVSTDLKEDKLRNTEKDKKVAQARDAENHPQVAPPNLEEKDDHAGERGEDGFQYPNPDMKQVETPDFKKQNEENLGKKSLLPPQDNDVMAQVNDMMNKSPGDINKMQGGDQNVLYRPPSPHLGPIANKILELKNGESPFMMRGADGHPAMDDKNYEEADDDDRENDDEPPNGGAPAMKGPNILQDNDFDDQENQDNGDNAKEVEGVVIAPK